jgi:hypothetical protein
MFDRFDVCMAYYLFACDWHSGQNSPEYRIFGPVAQPGLQTVAGAVAALPVG